jgi:hypothetical protein
MPALPPVPKVLRIDLLWNIGSDSGATTRTFFRYTGGPPSAADLTTFAAAVQAAAVTAFNALLGGFAQQAGTTVLDLDSALGASGEDLAVTNGGRSGGQMTASTAIVVSHAISRRYRGGKPRSYLPLGVEGDLAGTQAWDSTIVGDVTAAWAAFVAAVSALSAGSAAIVGPVNVSYYSGFLAAENPVTHRWKNISVARVSPLVDVITSSAARVKPGSQRRRN